MDGENKRIKRKDVEGEKKKREQEIEGNENQGGVD
jgi:hypothetical protein